MAEKTKSGIFGKALLGVGAATLLAAVVVITIPLVDKLVGQVLMLLMA